jgi:hypothetical protein
MFFIRKWQYCYTVNSKGQFNRKSKMMYSRPCTYSKFNRDSINTLLVHLSLQSEVFHYSSCKTCNQNNNVKDKHYCLPEEPVWVSLPIKECYPIPYSVWWTNRAGWHGILCFKSDMSTSDIRSCNYVISWNWRDKNWSWKGGLGRVFDGNNSKNLYIHSKCIQ